MEVNPKALTQSARASGGLFPPPAESLRESLILRAYGGSGAKSNVLRLLRSSQDLLPKAHRSLFAHSALAFDLGNGSQTHFNRPRTAGRIRRDLGAVSAPLSWPSVRASGQIATNVTCI